MINKKKEKSNNTHDKNLTKEDLREKIREFIDIVEEEKLSVFIGAGISKAASLPTMKDLVGKIEAKISNHSSDKVSKFLKEIISILKSESKELTVEQILETLYHLNFILKEREAKISLSIGSFGKVDSKLLLSSIDLVKETIHDECSNVKDSNLKIHSEFLKVLLGTSGGLRKLRIFTTNWDFVIEKVCDSLKYKCIDGFTGIFNAFENFYLFDEEITGNLATVLLFKIHGSLNWFLDNSAEKVHKLSISSSDSNSNFESLMIYPTPLKTREILGYPYSDLLSRFSDVLLNNSHPLLLVIGYSFQDSHISSKVSSMLINNSHSNVFIVDPELTLEDVSNSLGGDFTNDKRIKIIKTTFEDFTVLLKEVGKVE